MPDSIQIYQNSLLKLVVRSGYDSDRLSTILDVGEIGYTIDTNRLYVGDGITPGGVLVGNVFNGSRADLTSSPGTPAVGDYAFDSSRRVLYRFIGGSPSALGNWQAIGGVYSALNTTLSVTNTNQITVGLLSAENISQDALNNSLVVTSGRVGLSSRIATDFISPLTPGESLTLPVKIASNGVSYNLPSSVLNNGFLKVDSSGNLAWTSINTFLSAASSIVTLGIGLTGSVNGTPSTAFSLITSNNVTIRSLFAPVAHATIKQNGEITKNVSVASVTNLATSNLFGRPVNGGDLQVSSTSFDYIPPGIGGTVTGLYQFTFVDKLLPASQVYDIRITNGSYRRAANSSGIYSPVLESYYWITGDYTMVVAIYTTLTYINAINNTYNATTGPSFLTPGNYNEATRFSVTVYDG